MAVEALRGYKTVGELAEKFEGYPNHIVTWKAQLLERSSEFFGEKADGTPSPNVRVDGGEDRQAHLGE